MVQIKNKYSWSRVSYNLLESINEVPVDLYIKLSSIKYIKIYNESEDTLEALTSNYLAKEITNFYCQVQDYTKLVEYLLLNRVDVGAIRRAELIKELIDILGISPLVAKNIQAISLECLEEIRKDKALSTYIDSIFKTGNYLSQHSVLVSFISCLIAKEMDWKAQDVTTKLSYAGILHDLSLTDNILLELSRNENDINFLNWDEQEIYKSHIETMVTHLQTSTSIPFEISDIISNHHEFSMEQLSTNRKSPTSISQINALFIIADQFCHLIHPDDELNMSNALNRWVEFEEHFNKGNFKKPLQCIKKLLHTNILK